MVSKQKQERRALQEKLQQLRSISNSTATDSTEIIDDASKYIEKLMEKVEKLNLEIQTESTPSSSSNPDSSIMEVAVESVGKGFRVSVFSDENYDSLLASVLDVFDNLGLDVLDATISCSESFSLEALLEQSNIENKDGQPLNKQVIKEALLHALKIWNE